MELQHTLIESETKQQAGFKQMMIANPENDFRGQRSEAGGGGEIAEVKLLGGKSSYEFTLKMMAAPDALSKNPWLRFADRVTINHLGVEVYVNAKTSWHPNGSVPKSSIKDDVYYSFMQQIGPKTYRWAGWLKGSDVKRLGKNMGDWYLVMAKDMDQDPTDIKSAVD